MSDLAPEALVAAVDELRRERVLADADVSEAVQYDFTHPTLQATLYAELGKARTRLLHKPVASVILERLPPTILLMMASLSFAFFFGLLFGVIAARGVNRWPEH